MNTPHTIAADSLRTRVMRRVRFIHFLGRGIRVVRGPSGKLSAVLAIGIFTSVRFVAFDEVVRNLRALHGRHAFEDFVFGAVMNTEMAVLILGACAVLFLALAGLDFVRGSARLIFSSAGS